MIDRRKLEDILQECLAAFETGLTPDECLSAWPQYREALEPLLRQALMLRVSYSAMPRPEFRARTRESLLFHAGRDVRAALSGEPAPDFVTRTRNKLLHTAGASAQEALRDVPPPRLAFWVNARRRFLEAAATSVSQQPPSRSVVQTWRVGLSAAVVALALTLAGLAYFATQMSQPSSVNAELARIEAQLQQIELQGTAIPSDVIIDLISRTTSLALKLNQADQSQAQVADKLAEIIDRQYAVVDRNLASSSAPSPQLQQAKQQLVIAEDKVRVLASRSDAPSPQPQLEAQAPVEPAAPTLQPASPTPPPPTPRPLTPTPAPAQGPLTGNQIRVTSLPDNTTFGLAWRLVETRYLSFIIAANWTTVAVNGLGPDGTGLGTFEGSNFILQSPGGAIVVIGLRDGSVQALIGGERVILRDVGVDGDIIGVEELVRVAGPAGIVLELRYLLETVTFLNPDPAATPTRTSTPPPSATPTPRP